MGDLKTNEERRAEGRALRVDVPRSSHAGWVAPSDRPDPVTLLEEREPGSGARPRAHPRRPDARVAVRVPPRRRRGHGPRPGGHPGDRVAGPGVRRRPPAQLRRVRHSRAPPRLRRQRLRRDAARPVGVGRQATGGERRGRGSRRRREAGLGDDAVGAPWRGLPVPHGGAVGDVAARRLVRARSTSTRCWQSRASSRRRRSAPSSA